jgi:hypothetical protein
MSAMGQMGQMGLMGQRSPIGQVYAHRGFLSNRLLSRVYEIVVVKENKMRYPL